MLTRKGARRLTSMLDQVATVVQENPSVLGVDSRIAADFAYRCDLLSDAIETRAINNFPRQASEHDGEESEDEAPEAPKAESKKKASVQARLAHLRRLAAEADGEEAEEEAEDEAPKAESKKKAFARRAGFDASTIGEEVDGPLEQLDSDEPWMDDHFTQEKFEELRGAQQAGALGAKPYFAPNAKKASAKYSWLTEE